MKEQKSNASNKSVNTSIVEEPSLDSNQFQKSDENSDKQLPRWKWRKLARTLKYLSWISSSFLSLIKIFQELGLIP